MSSLTPSSVCRVWVWVGVWVWVWVGGWVGGWEGGLSSDMCLNARADEVPVSPSFPHPFLLARFSLVVQ